MKLLHDNTIKVGSVHLDTDKKLHTILQGLEEMREKIKSRHKNISDSGSKNLKQVTKMRNEANKAQATLEQTVTSWLSMPGDKRDQWISSSKDNDPFIQARNANYRLKAKIASEQQSLEQIKNDEDHLGLFEVTLVRDLQGICATFSDIMNSHHDEQKRLFSEVAANSQAIPETYEWEQFFQRNSRTLINKDTPAPSAGEIRSPEWEHPTNPAIDGFLERKHTLKGYSEHYYVVTFSKYLHQFASQAAKDDSSSPELSLYLPHCELHKVDGAKFNLKGKNRAGGIMSMSHDIQFKCATPGQSDKWVEILRDACNHTDQSQWFGQVEKKMERSPASMPHATLSGAPSTQMSFTPNNAPSPTSPAMPSVPENSEEPQRKEFSGLSAVDHDHDTPAPATA